MSIFGSPRSAPATHGPLVLLTGAPRSGTTPCCHLLDKVPGVVALHEPMKVDRFLAPAAADVQALVERFAAEMARLPDVHARQVHAISFFFDRYAELLPAPRILRYEDVVASHGRCLRAIAPAAASLDEGLRSRNANPSYARESMRALAGRLIESPGGWRRFYGESDVAGLLGAALASAE